MSISEKLAQSGLKNASNASKYRALFTILIDSTTAKIAM
jgi:hypothetical protein